MQKGQSITLTADNKFPDLCPVLSAMRMVIRARQLLQPDDMPLDMYQTRKSNCFYLTGGKIAELLRGAVKRIRPDISSEDIPCGFGHASYSMRLGSLPTTSRNDSVGFEIDFVCTCVTQRSYITSTPMPCVPLHKPSWTLFPHCQRMFLLCRAQ